LQNGRPAGPRSVARRGELLLLASEAKAGAEAEASFRTAIEIARPRGAIQLELRAATSLARLWRGRGRATEARGILAPVRARFTEGFDTADMRRARTLLDEIGPA